MQTSVMASPGDGELLAEFARGRQQACFAELVRRHGSMVLSVCRSVLHNSTDAEDAAQAVFLTLARKAESTSVQAHMVGWLHRVAWYVASRAAEARATRRRHELEAARMKPECQSRVDNSLPLEALHAGLDEIPDSYRVPLILHHLEGHSHQEVAALVGCSEAAIAVRLHRGREKLRKRLARKGVAVPAVVLAGVWATPAMAEIPADFVATTASAAVKPLVSAQVLALSNSALSMLAWAKVKMIASIVVIFAGLGGVVGIFLWTQKLEVKEPAAERSSAAAAGEAREPPLAAPVAPPAGFVTGVISRVSDGAVAVQRRGGNIVTIATNADTAIRLDDKPAAAADLRAGMSAAVFFLQGRPAHEIRAYSPGPKGPGSREN